MKHITSLFGWILLLFLLGSWKGTEQIPTPLKSPFYQNAKYYVSVAIVYFKMHENELTATYIDSALQVDRSYTYTHVLRSKLSERVQGNHPETIQILNYAVKSATSNLEKIQLYAKIANLQIQDKNYQDCQNTIASIFEIDSDAPMGYFEVALLNYKFQKYQEVLKITEKALDITSDKRRMAEFNFLAGLAHKNLNNKREAEKHFTASMQRSIRNAAKVELTLLK